MPRKRKPAGAGPRNDVARRGTIIAAEAGQASGPATGPAASAEPPETPAASPTTATLVDPYRPLFTCTPKGFEMGENRRFKQRVFRFKDKPEAAVLERLKAAGYTYRAQEKAWTVAAAPQSRLESEALAQAFAGTATLERADGGVGR